MAIEVKMLNRMGLAGGLALVMFGLIPGTQAQESSNNGIGSRLNNIWSRVFNDEKDPPKGSRGGLCAIAPTHPNADTPEIWHNPPVIVWQTGSVAKVSLATDPETAPFWEYIPAGDETSIVYDGAPLDARETYTLGVHVSKDAGPALIPDFKVLSAEERTIISNELESIASPNESTVSDAEWTAIQQAEYFVEHSLFYDAIQSLFAVSDPSAELIETQERIIEKACEG